MGISALHGQPIQHHNPSPPVRFVVEFKAFIPGSFGLWLPEPGRLNLLREVQFKTDERDFDDLGTSRVYSRATIATDPASPGDGLTLLDHDPKCDPSNRRLRRLGSSVWQYKTKTATPTGEEIFQHNGYNYRLTSTRKGSYPFRRIAFTA